jgi:hypothetical protein
MHGARVNSERKPGSPEFRVAIAQKERHALPHHLSAALAGRRLTARNGHEHRLILGRGFTERNAPRLSFRPLAQRSTIALRARRCHPG